MILIYGCSQMLTGNHCSFIQFHYHSTSYQLASVKRRVFIFNFTYSRHNKYFDFLFDLMWTVEHVLMLAQISIERNDLTWHARSKQNAALDRPTEIYTRILDYSQRHMRLTCGSIFLFFIMYETTRIFRQISILLEIKSVSKRITFIKLTFRFFHLLKNLLLPRLRGTIDQKPNDSSLYLSYS